MALELTGRFLDRYRPREGWLSLLLLLCLVLVVNTAVRAAGWVPEDTVVLPAALGGLLLAALLAKRPLGDAAAWTLITLYGLLLVVLTLGKLWPPLGMLGDWPALRAYWLENGALFIERVGGWYQALAAGGRSNETVVFALLLGLLAWFLAAYLGWSAYRQRQPLPGLLLLGLLVALNGYYGAAPIEYAAFFVGLAVLITAVFYFASLEQGWEQRMVDYSTQIRWELVLYAGSVGVTLLALAFLLPAMRLNRAASWLLGNENVRALEETFDRAFGGVEVARDRPIPAGQPGGAGILPRAFLIGNAPELSEIVMMTAEAEILSGPPGTAVEQARHWRALSYERYTGRGWTMGGDETPRLVRAGETVPLPPAGPVSEIRQSVHWRYDNRIVRYTLGEPLLFDHVVRAYFRGDDFSHAAAVEQQNTYEAVSRLSAATEEALRTAVADAVPFAIRRRYTALPGTLPERVRSLAAEVAGEEATPYDQALALESFLRQYPYSLDVALPPAGTDVVDFFLFEQQAGYCDYYASAMVVMARSLGLPARLATGFLAQEPDEEGQQTMHQIDAHAWAEVYFAGFGWVEFEPTASFPSPREAGGAVPATQTSAPVPPPIPAAQAAEQAPQALPWRWIASAVLLAAAGAASLVRRARRRGPALDPVQRAYGSLQTGAVALGQELSPGQTPYEFEAALEARLEALEKKPRSDDQASGLRSAAHELTALFVAHQYSPNPPDAGSQARRLWGAIRRPMWRLRLRRVLKRR